MYPVRHDEDDNAHHLEGPYRDYNTSRHRRRRHHHHHHHRQHWPRHASSALSSEEHGSEVASSSDLGSEGEAEHTPGHPDVPQHFGEGSPSSLSLSKRPFPSSSSAWSPAKGKERERQPQDPYTTPTITQGEASLAPSASAAPFHVPAVTATPESPPRTKVDPPSAATVEPSPHPQTHLSSPIKRILSPQPPPTTHSPRKRRRRNEGGEVRTSRRSYHRHRSTMGDAEIEHLLLASSVVTKVNKALPLHPDSQLSLLPAFQPPRDARTARRPSSSLPAHLETSTNLQNALRSPERTQLHSQTFDPSVQQHLQGEVVGLPAAHSPKTSHIPTPPASGPTNRSPTSRLSGRYGGQVEASRAPQMSPSGQLGPALPPAPASAQLSTLSFQPAAESLHAAPTLPVTKKIGRPLGSPNKNKTVSLTTHRAIAPRCSSVGPKVEFAATDSHPLDEPEERTSLQTAIAAAVFGEGGQPHGQASGLQSLAAHSSGHIDELLLAAEIGPDAGQAVTMSPSRRMRESSVATTIREDGYVAHEAAPTGAMPGESYMQDSGASGSPRLPLPVTATGVTSTAGESERPPSTTLPTMPEVDLSAEPPRTPTTLARERSALDVLADQAASASKGLFEQYDRPRNDTSPRKTSGRRDVSVSPQRKGQTSRSIPSSAFDKKDEHLSLSMNEGRAVLYNEKLNRPAPDQHWQMMYAPHQAHQQQQRHAGMFPHELSGVGIGFSDTGGRKEDAQATAQPDHRHGIEQDQQNEMVESSSRRKALEEPFHFVPNSYASPARSRSVYTPAESHGRTVPLLHDPVTLSADRRQTQQPPTHLTSLLPMTPRTLPQATSRSTPSHGHHSPVKNPHHPLPHQPAHLTIAEQLSLGVDASHPLVDQNDLAAGMTPAASLAKKSRSPYIKWTLEEDELLLRAIAKYGIRWDFVSKDLPNRSYHQCRQRWLRGLKSGDAIPEPLRHYRPEVAASIKRYEEMKGIHAKREPTEAEREE